VLGPATPVAAQQHRVALAMAGASPSPSYLVTLRHERDNPVLLDGHVIPADLGRELAGYARAFRRLVTDPVNGHLLDDGSASWLTAWGPRVHIPPRPVLPTTSLATSPAPRGQPHSSHRTHPLHATPNPHPSDPSGALSLNPGGA
jgi:hypothetical protein